MIPCGLDWIGVSGLVMLALGVGFLIGKAARKEGGPPRLLVYPPGTLARWRCRRCIKERVALLDGGDHAATCPSCSQPTIWHNVGIYA